MRERKHDSQSKTLAHWVNMELLEQVGFNFPDASIIMKSSNGEPVRVYTTYCDGKNVVIAEVIKSRNGIRNNGSNHFKTWHYRQFSGEDPTFLSDLERSRYVKEVEETLHPRYRVPGIRLEKLILETLKG